MYICICIISHGIASHWLLWVSAYSVQSVSLTAISSLPSSSWDVLRFLLLTLHGRLSFSIHLHHIFGLWLWVLLPSCITCLEMFPLPSWLERWWMLRLRRPGMIQSNYTMHTRLPYNSRSLYQSLSYVQEFFSYITLCMLYKYWPLGSFMGIGLPSHLPLKGVWSCHQ